MHVLVTSPPVSTYFRRRPAHDHPRQTTHAAVVVGGESAPGTADREIKIYVQFSLVAPPTILV